MMNYTIHCIVIFIGRITRQSKVTFFKTTLYYEQVSYDLEFREGDSSCQELPLIEHGAVIVDESVGIGQEVFLIQRIA